MKHVTVTNVDDRFPKPWRVEQTDPQSYAVVDTNGRKLFYISEDDPGDIETLLAGDPMGPTVLGFGSDDDDEALRTEIVRMFAMVGR